MTFQSAKALLTHIENESSNERGFDGFNRMPWLVFEQATIIKDGVLGDTPPSLPDGALASQD